MKVSVLIPTKNDFDYLDKVINTLLWDSPYDVDLEIIVVNDGSIASNGSPLSIKDWFNYTGGKVRVIENGKNFGVGYSFDRGAEEATGDILVLMACDVFPRGGVVLQEVVKAVSKHPQELGCCTSLGLNPDNLDMGSPDINKRYGADILWTVGLDDLPPESKLRKTIGGYTSILRGKWREGKDSDEPYMIPCAYGAFYFCTKEFYQKMHGFDTKKGIQFRGHIKWGHLEPFLSLKAEIYGDGVRVYPQIEVGHVFSRKTEGARAMEHQYWNALWIAYTMLEEDFRDELRNFLHFNSWYSIAQHWVRQHKEVINEVRERNLREAKLISKP